MRQQKLNISETINKILLKINPTKSIFDQKKKLVPPSWSWFSGSCKLAILVTFLEMRKNKSC